VLADKKNTFGDFKNKNLIWRPIQNGGQNSQKCQNRVQHPKKPPDTNFDALWLRMDFFLVILF
jgi:hypothetical protein